MATGFGCRANSVCVDPICHALEIGDVDVEGLGPEIEATSYGDVELPTGGLLRSLSPSTLQRVRDSDEAQEYFDAQDSLIGAIEPGQSDALSLYRETWADALDRYARAMPRYIRLDEGFQKWELRYQTGIRVLEWTGRAAGAYTADSDIVEILRAPVGEQAKDVYVAGKLAKGFGSVVLRPMRPAVSVERVRVSPDDCVGQPDVIHPIPLRS